MSTPAITKIQYTSKDFATLRNELIARIPALTGGRWTDLNESDPGIAIVELLTAMMDEMLFYLDQSANEAFLPTAVQRGDVANLVRLIDYAPASIKSAAGQVDFIFGAAPTYPVVIPPYTRVATSKAGGINFVTTTLFGAVDPTPVPFIVNMASTVTMNIVEGTKSEDTFISDATPTQTYKLSQLNIDTTTVLITVNGTPWQKVSSFVSADLNSEQFVVTNDAKGYAYVTFGDGKFGMIPPDGATIVVTYVVSSGDLGTTGAGKIRSLLDTLQDSMAVNVTDVLINNLTSTAAGLSLEPIERTKALAPALLAALFTAKSKGDYNALVQAASSSITKVNTWGEAEESPPNYKLYNKVQIAFAGNQSADPSKILLPATPEFTDVKTAVTAYLNEGSRKIITTRNVFIDPQFVDIIIGGTVYANLIAVDSASVLVAVTDAINSAFGYEGIAFGQDIYLSQLQNVVAQIPGVVWSELTLDATPTTFPLPDGGDRYRYNLSVFPPTHMGVILKKFEIPIVEDDPKTGRTSGFDGTIVKHVQVTIADAVDQPRGGDILNNPCAV